MPFDYLCLLSYPEILKVSLASHWTAQVVRSRRIVFTTNDDAVNSMLLVPPGPHLKILWCMKAILQPGGHV